MAAEPPALVPTKPYLIRAINEWCVDQGFTPYVAVFVDARVRVPMEFVRDGQIVLNIGPEAVQQLSLGNDFIRFSARFRGVVRHIEVPVTHVTAIYARENGHGMAFEISQEDLAEANPQEVSSGGKAPALESIDATNPSPVSAVDTSPSPASAPAESNGKGKPRLTVVK